MLEKHLMKMTKRRAAPAVTASLYMTMVVLSASVLPAYSLRPRLVLLVSLSLSLSSLSLSLSLSRAHRADEREEERSSSLARAGRWLVLSSECGSDAGSSSGPSSETSCIGEERGMEKKKAGPGGPAKNVRLCTIYV
eukprot:scaffold217187_cov23-Tisochrysis_lutea.AAC.2